jgi:hypothetical protein
VVIPKIAGDADFRTWGVRVPALGPGQSRVRSDTLRETAPVVEAPQVYARAVDCQNGREKHEGLPVFDARIRLAKTTDQVRARLDAEGWCSVARRAAVRLCAPVYRTIAVARFEIPVHTIREPALPQGIAFSELRHDEVTELARFSPHVMPREIERRLAAGFVCHIARDRGRIVFCGWLGWGAIPLPFLDTTLRLPPAWGCSYNVFADPAHRGVGLFRCYANRLAAACAQRRIQSLVSFVDLSNGIPLRAYVRLTGATRMSVVRHRRVAWFWSSTRVESVAMPRAERCAATVAR